MYHEVHHCVAVAKFIVIPGDDIDKVVIEGNVSPSIKGGGVDVTVEVTGDHLVLSVVQDTLHGALACLFHHLLDLILLSSIFHKASQVHHRHTGSGHMEGHARSAQG